MTLKYMVMADDDGIFYVGPFNTREDAKAFGEKVHLPYMILRVCDPASIQLDEDEEAAA